MSTTPQPWEREIQPGVCARGCSERNRHLPGCTNGFCSGCAPRTAVDGTDLCIQCHRSFPRTLNDLARSWDVLEAHLHKSTGYRQQERVSGSRIRDYGVIWNPWIAAVMADLADWTGFLTRLIDSLNLPETTLPTGSSFLMNQDTPPALALGVHARYNGRHFTDWAFLSRFLVDDAERFMRRIDNALARQGLRSLPLPDSFCTYEVEEDQLGVVQCGGQLVATFSPDDRPSQVLCRNHPGHQVPTWQWPFLAKEPA